MPANNVEIPSVNAPVIARPVAAQLMNSTVRTRRIVESCLNSAVSAFSLFLKTTTDVHKTAAKQITEVTESQNTWLFVNDLSTDAGTLGVTCFRSGDFVSTSCSALAGTQTNSILNMRVVMQMSFFIQIPFD